MPFADPDAQRAYMREWVARRRAEWFADKSCARCGSTDRLELDHVDPTKKISHRIWSWSEERRRVELEKCQVLCEPCHEAKTTEDRLAHVEHGTYTMRWKFGCKCEECLEYVRRQKRESRERLAAAV